MVLIVINAIILGLETVPSVMSSYGSIGESLFSLRQEITELKQLLKPTPEIDRAPLAD